MTLLLSMSTLPLVTISKAHNNKSTAVYIYIMSHIFLFTLTEKLYAHTKKKPAHVNSKQIFTKVHTYHNSLTI